MAVILTERAASKFQTFDDLPVYYKECAIAAGLD
jgi:hypothetical protein